MLRYNTIFCVSVCGLILTFSWYVFVYYGLYRKGVFSVYREEHARRRYVSFPQCRRENGIGNQLFYLTGAVFVAEMLGRQPAMMTNCRNVLYNVFDLKIPRLRPRGPFYNVRHRACGAYDRELESITIPAPMVDRTVMVQGVYDSWKYAARVDGQLRRILRFKPRHVRLAERFMADNVPDEWKTSGGQDFVRVGIHVRRGNFLSHRYSRLGFVAANETYFEKATKYFTDRFRRVQFIVCSNDIGWCKANIRQEQFANTTSFVNVTYSVGHSSAEDLALLASCDHVIMSTGTYGWWAAWLTNGISVYCTDHPRPGSWLATERCGNVTLDWFPPTWVGMSGS